MQSLSTSPRAWTTCSIILSIRHMRCLLMQGMEVYGGQWHRAWVKSPQLSESVVLGQRGHERHEIPGQRVLDIHGLITLWYWIPRPSNEDALNIYFIQMHGCMSCVTTKKRLGHSPSTGIGYYGHPITGPLICHSFAWELENNGTKWKVRNKSLLLMIGFKTSSLAQV